MVETSPYELLTSLAVVAALIMGETNRNDVFFTTPQWLGEAVTLCGTLTYYLILTVLLGSIFSMYFHRSSQHILVLNPHIFVFALAIFFYFMQSTFSEIAYSFRYELEDFKNPKNPSVAVQFVAADEPTFLRSKLGVSEDNTAVTGLQQIIVYILRALPHFTFGICIVPYLFFLRRLSARRQRQSHRPSIKTAR